MLRNIFIRSKLRAFKNLQRRKSCCLLISSKYSTHAKVEIQENSEIRSKALEVHSPKWSNAVTLPLHWFRDNCQCPACKDPTTGLRLAGLVSPLEQPSEVVDTVVETDCLQITWSDGHISLFDLNWLWKNCYEGQSEENVPMKKTLWNAEIAKSIPFEHVQYKDLLTSEDTVKKFLASVLNYGISIVDNVPATSEHTRTVMERFGPIWRTFWGEIYHVVADLTQHSHPSYTGVDLAFHTDTNYYFEGAGLQAFHLLEHTGTGGRNRFVDGFNVAGIIKQQFPEIYEYLSTKPVSFKYIESKLHLVNEDVLFKHHPVTKELVQLRYTPYDFDTFRTVDQNEAETYYNSLQVLIKAIKDSVNAHYIQLKPGSVLVTDNWRILHGRTEFTGKRVLCGMWRSHSFSRLKKGININGWLNAVRMKKVNMYGHVTHVIFDLDGLILDTETIFEQCYQIIANEFGKLFTWEIQAQIMGASAQMGARKIVDELQLPITPEEFMEKTKKLCKKLLPDAKTKPGAERLIRHLHHHKIPIAVATSSSGGSCRLKTQHHLELFDLFHHVTSAVDDPMVKRAKPFPDVFLACASHFDIVPLPEKVLVIEDSPAGVEAGLAANMPVLMVPDGRLDPLKTKRATQVIKSLKEFQPETFGLPSYDGGDDYPQ